MNHVGIQTLILLQPSAACALEMPSISDLENSGWATILHVDKLLPRECEWC